MKHRAILAGVAAPAAAIVVFGAIYGGLARPVMGTGATMLSSLLVFSGAVQFTVAALLPQVRGRARSSRDRSL